MMNKYWYSSINLTPKFYFSISFNEYVSRLRKEIS